MIRMREETQWRDCTAGFKGNDVIDIWLLKKEWLQGKFKDGRKLDMADL